MPTPTLRLTDLERDRQDAAVRKLLPIIKHYEGEDRCAAIRGLWKAVRDWQPGGRTIKARAIRKAHNEVRDERKWLGRTRHAERLKNYHGPTRDSPQLESEEFWSTVYSALPNPYHRGVIDYIYRQGGLQSDLSRLMGISECAITKIKKQAIARLRPAMEKMEA